MRAKKNKEKEIRDMIMPESFADAKEPLDEHAGFPGPVTGLAIMVSSHPSSVHDAFPSAQLQSATQTPIPKAKAQANKSKTSKDRERCKMVEARRG